MKINKLIIGIFFIFLFLNMISANTDTLVQNSNSDVIVHCINNGFCSSSTVCNITISNPDNIILIDNQQMTRSSNGGFYNYTLNSTQTSELGEHNVVGFCKDGSVTELLNFPFEITASGNKISNSGIVYSILLIIMFLLNLLIFYIIFRLEHENPRNEASGEFMGISLKKYIRVFLIGISYGLVLLTLNLMNAATSSLSEISQFSGIIGGLFLLMLGSAWVWTFCIFIWILVLVIKDSHLITEIKQKLNEGGIEI